jgi:hypothetical protein
MSGNVAATEEGEKQRPAEYEGAPQGRWDNASAGAFSFGNFTEKALEKML